LGLGHAVEGTTPASVRAGALADPGVARVPAEATLGEARIAQRGEGRPVVVVVDADDVVLGALRPDTLGGADDTAVVDVLQPGPPTVRPSITAAELAQSMDEEGQDHVLVSHLDGRLVGLVRRRDLDLDA
jgi:CBS domain-containing protein